MVVLDLSGTEIVGVLMDLRGGQVERRSLPLERSSSMDALPVIYTLLDQLVDTASAPLLGISIGTPGLIDSLRGFIYLAVNLNWRNLDLGALLKERYHLPVYINNDSHAAVLAEYSYGRWRGEPDQVLVKVGEGIGAGILLNGKVYYGAGSMAGEIGHLSMVENGEHCNCGNVGCLETVASIPAILQRARRLAVSRPQSFLNQRLSSNGQITIDDLALGFDHHDALVEQIVVYTGQYLGRAVAEMVSVLNATRIILCGEIERFGIPFLDVVRNELKKRVLPVLMENVEISFSNLGDSNVLLGCSAMVLSDQFGLP
jgi:predicted NBD/HSP70 family sugar kinase